MGYMASKLFFAAVVVVGQSHISTISITLHLLSERAKRRQDAALEKKLIEYVLI